MTKRPTPAARNSAFYWRTAPMPFAPTWHDPKKAPPPKPASQITIPPSVIERQLQGTSK